MESQDRCCHVSVGGLDSITLYLWLHSIGIHVPGITVSGIEDRSIQRVHSVKICCLMLRSVLGGTRRAKMNSREVEERLKYMLKRCDEDGFCKYYLKERNCDGCCEAVRIAVKRLEQEAQE